MSAAKKMAREGKEEREREFWCFKNLYVFDLYVHSLESFLFLETTIENIDETDSWRERPDHFKQ